MQTSELTETEQSVDIEKMMSDFNVLSEKELNQTTNGPLLISFDKQAYTREIEYLKTCVLWMEECILLFNDMKIGQFQPENLLSLFSDTKTFLTDSLLTLAPKEIGGMPVNRNQMFALLTTPVGFTSLIIRIETFNKRLDTPSNIFDRFTFNSNGKLEIKTDVIEYTKRINEVYITSDRAKGWYRFAYSLKNLLNDFGVKRPMATDLGQFIGSILSFDGEEREIKISSIKSFDNENR